MKTIKIITDVDFGLTPQKFRNPRTRIASRGIILNKEGKIAILNKQLKNEYKLIGGGKKNNETPQETFIREVLEETGCKINVIEFLGTTEEHKSYDNFKQVSYVFVGEVVEIGDTNYTQKEKDEESRLLWLDYDEAMKLIQNFEDNIKPSKYENIYHTKFIVKRDYEILKYYKEKFNN